MQMHEVTFEEFVEKIYVKDSRYARDVYRFVREALDFTQNAVVRTTKEKRGRSSEAKPGEPIRHVSGQELLNGIREYALKEFGPMVPTVFEEWGVCSCADFGEIVFNMVEIGLLAKTENDSREDFKNGYDFDEAFRNPFLPSSKKPAEHMAE